VPLASGVPLACPSILVCPSRQASQPKGHAKEQAFQKAMAHAHWIDQHMPSMACRSGTIHLDLHHMLLQYQW